MKNNPLRKVENSLFNISSQTVEQNKTFQKVRSSVALFGFALSIGSVGILLNQQDEQPANASPLPNSDQSSQVLDRISNQTTLIKSNPAFSTNFVVSNLAVNEAAISEGNDRVILDPLNTSFIPSKKVTNAKLDLAETVKTQSSDYLEVAEVDSTVQVNAQVNSQVNAQADAQTNISNTNTSNKSEVDRQLLDQIVTKLKSGASIEAVANQYRQLSKATKTMPEAIAVENETQESGKIVPIAFRRERQSRRNSLARQISKQPKVKTYRVALGDTLEAISKRSRVSQRTLVRLNKIKNPNLLIAGQSIRIPTSSSSISSRSKLISKSRSNFVTTRPVKVRKEIAANLIQKFDNRSVKFASTLPLLQIVAPANLPQASERSLATLDHNRKVSERPTSETRRENRSSKNLRTIPSTDSNNFPGSTQNFSNNFSAEKVEKVAKVIPSNLTNNLGSLNLIEQLPSTNDEAPVAKLPSVLPVSLPSLNDLPAENSSNDLKENQNKDIQNQDIQNQENQIEAKSSSDLNPSQSSSQSVIITPTKILVATLPKPIDAQVLEQNQLNGKPMELPSIPEAEASISSAEMQQAELKSQVKEQLPTKIAAANIDSLPLLQMDRSNKIVQQNKVSPQLPALSASAYLPNMVSPLPLSSSSSNSYSSPRVGNIANSSFIWPAAGILSSGFGWRWGRVHQGIDIAGPVGTPIVAAASGVVQFSGWNRGGYGNMVDIRHEDGTVTRYAHNSALYVRAGQAVNQGQAIAAMGSTGFSTGPHLHFEIRPNGRHAVNPITYLARR